MISYAKLKTKKKITPKNWNYQVSITNIHRPSFVAYHMRYGKITRFTNENLKILTIHRYKNPNISSLAFRPAKPFSSRSDSLSLDFNKLTYELKINDEKRIVEILGIKGYSLIKKIVLLITYHVEKDCWPLTKVEISHVVDPEVPDWKYILFTLFFLSDFQTADEYLHQFYGYLDSAINKLSNLEKELLQEKIFFDVKTVVSKDKPE